MVIRSPLSASVKKRRIVRGRVAHGRLRGANLVCFSLDEALSFHNAGEMLCREVMSRRSYPRVESAASCLSHGFGRLLRACRKRPGDGAAQKRNEFASLHPIELHPTHASQDRSCERNANGGAKPPQGR